VEEGRVKRGIPVIRTALLFAALLGSLTLVVWRQSQALTVLRELDRVRSDRVVEEARRAALLRRVEHLESRSRVSELARTRFGMRLPTGDEIVILPLREPGIAEPAAPPTVASGPPPVVRPASGRDAGAAPPGGGGEG
jgi:cell division protein FtsL